MPLSSSARTVGHAVAEAFTPAFVFPEGHEEHKPQLAPNLGATQDIGELLKGSREMPSVLAIAYDTTPSTKAYRDPIEEGRKKARERFAKDRRGVGIYVLEQLVGLPLGNTGFKRAADSFAAPAVDCYGSPLGNGLHQKLDAIEHFLRSAAKLGNPAHSVVFVPALDWEVNCEKPEVIKSAAARTEALAKKVGKRFFVQPVAVGDHAVLGVAELFAFQRPVLRLEEVDYQRFYDWLVEVSQRASMVSHDFEPPDAEFLKPVKK